MKIGGLQKLTLLDYPGKTACTVFLQGCNFRCPYCHNGGLVLPTEEDELLDEEEFFEFLKKRVKILDGVCVTGGEPLLQKEIIPFLQRIKSFGYEIKLDTNGSFPEKLKEICEMGLIDYVAMDIKHVPEKYPKAIGCQNISMDTICSSVEYLMSGSVDYEFRTTLVKGIHNPEDMDGIAEWIQGARRYFLQNFKDSGNLVGGNTQNITMDSFTESELTEFLSKTIGKVDALIRNV